MGVNRRSTLKCVGSLGFLAASSLTTAAAQVVAPARAATRTSAATDDIWPNHPVRYVVPFSAGGATDIIGRLLSQKLSTAFNQPFQVDIRAGAGGSLGAAEVAKAPADGYTLLGGTIATHAINSAVNKKLAYDPIKDFEPISLVAFLPNVLMVRSSLAANSVRELIDLMQRDESTRLYSSSGVGTSQHLSAEVFADKIGLKLKHMPTKGSVPSIEDVAAGKVTFTFDQITAAMPAIKAGRIKVLAVTTRKGTPLARDLPTMFEAGIPNFEVSSWQAVFAPKGTPQPIIHRLNTEIVRALKQADLKDKLYNEYGMQIVGSSPEELKVWLQIEIPRWAYWADKAGITASL